MSSSAAANVVVDLTNEDDSDKDTTDQTSHESSAAKLPAVKHLLSQNDVDNDDDNVAVVAKKMRKSATTTGGGSSTTAAAAAATTTSLAADGVRVVEAPIQLFATSQDEELRRRACQSSANGSSSSHQPHWSWTQCTTLREMLGIGKRRISIEWLVVSNYLVDFEFLIQEIPELLSVPNIVFFYGTAFSPPPAIWRTVAAPGSNNQQQQQKVELVQLCPSDPPGGRTNPMPVSIPYGVHHTKLFLVGYSDGTCRVVVHTANLVPGDIHLKAQAAYIQEFPLKTPPPPPPPPMTNPYARGHERNASSSDFEETLVAYMDSYCYRKQRPWYQGKSEYLTTCLRRFDFSNAKVVLIPSVPGYHRLTDAPQHYGHWKLRQTVAALHATKDDDDKEPAATSGGGPIVCQFSSIGSLSEKYLRELQISMDTNLSPIRNRAIPSFPISLHLVYPTASEIRDSIEGYRGGGSVPGTSKNLSKAFLRPLLRKWSSSPSSASPSSASLHGTKVSSPPVLSKGQNVPHIKTFYQMRPNDDSLEWFVVTSHNLSKAAWGEVQNSQRHGGRRLFIRHWELGVFVSPQLLGVDRLVPFGEVGENADQCLTVATVPIPYKTRPEPYGKDDKPWMVDAMYAEADGFGRHSASDF